MSDVAIIGAGPAGIATALQLKIYGINCLVYEKHEIGGLLRNANLVENYLGFPRGIKGIALIELLKEQIERLQVTIIRKTIDRVGIKNDMFELESNDELSYCNHLVLASGSKPKSFLLNGELINVADRILTEIHTLFDRKNLQISIVGAGDAAFDYALNLSIHNQICIHNRGERVRCLQHLFESAMNNSQVTYNTNSTLRKIDFSSDELYLTWENTGRTVHEYVDYLILAIGREPDTSCLGKDVYENMSYLTEKGKLFLVGDVTNGIYRQTAISAGDGIMTAMKLNKIIKE